jgi:hypothetical protein
MAKHRNPQPAWVLGDYIPRLAISAVILAGITIAYFQVRAEQSEVSALQDDAHPVMAEDHGISVEEYNDPDLDLNAVQLIYHAHVRFVAPSRNVIEGKVPVTEEASRQWQHASRESPGRIRLITNTSGTEYLEAVHAEALGGVTHALQSALLALLVPAGAYFMFMAWRMYRAFRRSRKAPQPDPT